MPIDVPTLRAFKETVQRDQIPHDEFSHVYSPIPAPFDPSRGQSPVVQISLIIASRGIERSRDRSEEHTSELQSRLHLVCRLLLEKKNNNHPLVTTILPH